MVKHHSYSEIGKSTAATSLAALQQGIFYRRKEGNVLFNDALNTILFMVKWRLTYGKGLLR